MYGGAVEHADATWRSVEIMQVGAQDALIFIESRFAADPRCSADRAGRRMNGVRLRRQGAQVGTTDFMRCFGGVLPMLRPYAWLVSEAMFGLPPEWELGYDTVRDRPIGPEWDRFLGYTIAVLRSSSPWTLSLQAPGFVQEYGRFLVDDWCHIAAVPVEAASVELLQKAAGCDVPWRLPEVVACFSNTDAGPWEFRAQQGAMVDDLRTMLARRADLEIVELEAPA